jgi:hypothetical protein
MRSSVIRRLRIASLISAFVLTAVDGLGVAYLGPLWFGYPHGTLAYTDIVLRAILWIPVLICNRWPRIGLAIYLLILIAAMMVHFRNTGGVRPDSPLDLEYDIWAGFLLVAHLILARKESLE